jgi:hypothetical protein
MGAMDRSMLECWKNGAAKIGVLEYSSTGVMGFEFPTLQYSITPTLPAGEVLDDSYKS